MNVASLPLCKELYQASNGSWDIIDTLTDSYVWAPYSVDGGETTQWQVERMTEAKGIYDWPAYDLGYLLKKLPESIQSGHGVKAWLNMECLGGDGWQFSYRPGKSLPLYVIVADTPEDAAAKLAIELFRQGVLNHE